MRKEFFTASEKTLTWHYLRITTVSVLKVTPPSLFLSNCCLLRLVVTYFSLTTLNSATSLLSPSNTFQCLLSRDTNAVAKLSGPLLLFYVNAITFCFLPAFGAVIIYSRQMFLSNIDITRPTRLKGYSSDIVFLVVMSRDIRVTAPMGIPIPVMLFCTASFSFAVWMDLFSDVDITC